MKKTDIIEKVYEKLDVPRAEVAKTVELVFDTIKEALQQGEKVVISGFGNFGTRSKAARRGRNPQTGGEVELAARRVLTFKPSHVLRKRVNKPKDVTVSPPGEAIEEGGVEVDRG